MNSLKSNDSLTTILKTFQVITRSDLKTLLSKILNSIAPSDVIPTRLCKIGLTDSPDYFIALINLTLKTGYFSWSIQTRRREASHHEVYLESELLSC